MWRILGASVAGDAHTRAGRGCDDAHGWYVTGQLAVAAIADGAGSRSGTSAVGAHAAVGAVLRAARAVGFAERVAADAGAVVGELFSAALRDLEACAARLDLAVDLLATTLCVLVADASGVAVGQVGDGLAVVDHAGEVTAVAVADRSEYANETVFLTSAGALDDHLKTYLSDGPLTRVALATDGLRLKVLDDVAARTPFAPFFRDAWAFAARADATSAAVARFLETVDDQTGDDKTLVVAVSRYDGPPGPSGVLAGGAPTPAGATRR